MHLIVCTQGIKKSSFKMKTETLEDTSKNKDMTNQTMGYLIMFMLFSAVNLSGFILKEKENRTYFRLLSTPIDGKKFILSNVAVNMMILTLQIVIAVLFLTNVFHTNINMPFIVMIGVLMIFALIAIGLSLVIVSFSKKFSCFKCNAKFNDSTNMFACWMLFPVRHYAKGGTKSS